MGARIIRGLHALVCHKMLLLSILAGGAGLNLAGGSRLFICGSLWNPGVDEQLIGRLLRMKVG